MAPTLRHGDWIVAWRCTRARVGDVVVLEHPWRPGLLVVKRVARLGQGGYWVLGDSPDASTDSRQFGPVGELVGRVFWRVRPWGRVRAHSMTAHDRRPGIDGSRYGEGLAGANSDEPL